MEYKDHLIKRINELIANSDLKYYEDSLEKFSKYSEEEIRKLYCFDVEMIEIFETFMFDCFKCKLITEIYQDGFELVKPYMVDDREISYYYKALEIRKIMSEFANHFESIGIPRSPGYNYYESLKMVYKQSKCINNILETLDDKMLGDVAEFYKFHRALLNYSTKVADYDITVDYMNAIAKCSNDGNFAEFFDKLNCYYLIKEGIDNNLSGIETLTKLVNIVSASNVNDRIKKYLMNRVTDLCYAYSTVESVVNNMMEGYSLIK